MAVRKLSLGPLQSGTARLFTTVRYLYCSASSSSIFGPQLGHEFSPETENFPVYPQNKVNYTGNKVIQVGFLLARQPVVMPDVHPLEQELANLLQNEYNVYNRHRVGFEMDDVAAQVNQPKLSGKKMKSNEQSSVKRNIAHSSQNFWKERGISLDQWGRSEDGSKKIDPVKKDLKRKEKKEDKKDVGEVEALSGSFQDNFFNIAGYFDAQNVVVNNWNPAQRFTPSDFADIVHATKYQLTRTLDNGEKQSNCETTTLMTPNFISRRTTCRKYQNFLYMIVCHPTNNSDHNISLKWSVPYGPRRQGESLRSTLDRLLSTFTERKENDMAKQPQMHHYSLYVPSNAPQGVFYENGDANRPVYVFIVFYTENHNVYTNINTPLDTANVMNIDFTKRAHILDKKTQYIDFNWVSRKEMSQYVFPNTDMQQLVLDMCINGVGE